MNPNGGLSLCNFCNAACCKDIGMDLTDKEAQFMQNGGADMNLIENPEDGLCDNESLGAPEGSIWLKPLEAIKNAVTGSNKKPEKKLYHVVRCGYLRSNSKGTLYCSVHNDPQRPEVCKNFKAGGWGCIQARLSKGIQPIELE